MSNTEHNYQETDLGNVSPNPRGEYDPSTEYEYLDLVSYQGGSYLCLAELGAKKLYILEQCSKEEGLSISEFRVTLFFISYAVFCTARALISSKVRSVKTAISS